MNNLKIYGSISKITTKTVSFERFNYENLIIKGQTYGWTDEHEVSMSFGPEITVKYDIKIIDELLKYSERNQICEFEIEKGVIKSIKPFKTQQEVVIELQKGRELFEPQRMSLQDKMRILIKVLCDMEIETFLVPIKSYLQKLEKEHGLDKKETINLVNHLVKEGTFFIPKAGHIKKT